MMFKNEKVCSKLKCSEKKFDHLNRCNVTLSGIESIAILVTISAFHLLSWDDTNRALKFFWGEEEGQIWTSHQCLGLFLTLYSEVTSGCTQEIMSTSTEN